MFDEFSKGIVFSGVFQPNKKLGLIYCTNRPASIYYIREPQFGKSFAQSESYILNLGQGDFLQMFPKFNSDYSKLVFFGSEKKFLSHTGNYQLRQFDWPIVDPSIKSKILIDLVEEI